MNPCSYGEAPTTGRISNPSLGAAPVYNLPTETLIHIFQLVLENPCRNVSLRTSIAGIRKSVWQPDCLAHVCSRWREIALSLPHLWSHIDLTPAISRGGGLMNAARVYPQRAQSIPLEVHIDDTGCVGDEDYYTLENILRELAPCLGTLDFIITAHRLLDFHCSALDAVIPELSPKIFKKLRISSESSLPDPFFVGQSIGTSYNHSETSDIDDGPPILRWDNQLLDSRFSGVTILHLRGVFFNWPSKLYHGLVDLRLTCPPTGSVPEVSHHALTSILLGSPGLRILYFSLKLTGDPQGETSPVDLRDLEVIQVSTIPAYNQITPTQSHDPSLLQLLAPGSKPLRLTLEVNPSEPVFDWDHVKEFFARSKVEKLCIKGGRASIDEFGPRHMPDLKVLVLDSCQLGSVHADPNPPLRLNSCFVHGARLNLDQLCLMVKSFCTQLVLSAYEIYLRDHEQMLTEQELRTSFHAVRFLLENHDPTADWDIIG